MKTALKIAGFFLLIVLFLSITVKNKTLFGHIYNVISPGTQGAQKVAESIFKSSIDASHRYSKKIFENSVPKVKDTLRMKNSAPTRTSDLPDELILDDEKANLDDLIKSHN